MKNSFVPLARRFALAGAVPVAATLAFASTAFAEGGLPCPPPKVIKECKGAEVSLRVQLADVLEFEARSGGLTTTTLERGNQKKTINWGSVEANRGELAKFTAKSRSKRDIVKVVVRDLDGKVLAEVDLSLSCEDEPSPSPSTSPSPHPSVSPSASPRPSASPSPSATPTSGQPGLPKTGLAAE